MISICKPISMDDESIYLHVVNDGGVYRLADQFGRTVKGVRSLTVDFGYQDVSTFTLHGILARPDAKPGDDQSWKHVNNKDCVVK